MSSAKEILNKVQSGAIAPEKVRGELESHRPYIVFDGYFEDIYGVKHKDTGEKYHKGVHLLIRFGDTSIREEEDNE